MSRIIWVFGLLAVALVLWAPGAQAQNIVDGWNDLNALSGIPLDIDFNANSVPDVEELQCFQNAVDAGLPAALQEAFDANTLQAAADMGATTLVLAPGADAAMGAFATLSDGVDPWAEFVLQNYVQGFADALGGAGMCGGGLLTGCQFTLSCNTSCYDHSQASQALDAMNACGAATTPVLGCPDDLLIAAEVPGGLSANDPEIIAFLFGAAIIDVDFEDLDLPSGTPITNEVASITISNGGVAVDPVDVLGVPTELDTNGENTLFNLDPLAPLELDFDSPVTGLRMEGSAFAGTIMLEAFDAGGGSLAVDFFEYGDGDPASTSTNGDIELPMASSARNISRIVITYFPSLAVDTILGPVSFVVDDFVYVWDQLVDFEGLPNFTIPATDQFEGVTVGNGIVVSDPVLVLGIPTDLDPNGENTLAVFADAAAPITFTFDEPASNISLELAAFEGIFTVNSFDAGGFFIDSEVFAVPTVVGLNIPLSVSGASSIEVQNSAGYVVDDLTFSFGHDPSISITHDAPADFPVGSTTVTFTATNSAGNSSTCSAVLTVSTKPTAIAGADQTGVECTGTGFATVTLNGSASSDPDPGDTLSYAWSTDMGVLPLGETAVIEVQALLGTHTYTLVVTDSFGVSDSDSVDITVVDTTAPTLTVAATPDFLWPANHKMHDISLAVTVEDACDPNPTIELVSVSSNESDNGFNAGDGNTSNDIERVDDFNVRLRAERSGNGGGRIYTIVYRATDASGNSVDVEQTVEVPHDQGSHSCDNPDCDLNNS